MHGPPLTPQECAAAVADRVEKLIALDIDRPSAIRAIAREHGVNPIAVVWCLQQQRNPQSPEEN